MLWLGVSVEQLEDAGQNWLKGEGESLICLTISLWYTGLSSLGLNPKGAAILGFQSLLGLSD